MRWILFIKKLMKIKNNNSIAVYLIAVILMLLIFTICVSFGSTGFNFEESIIYDVRLPRVICVALIGASLSVCGAAMQGLLRNPLADGTTLGVSSGASLGAVISIVLSSLIPVIPIGFANILTIAMSMACAFVSLIIIMALAHLVDFRLSTNTIILVGVVFSMFASAFISLLVALFPQNAKTVTF